MLAGLASKAANFARAGTSLHRATRLAGKGEVQAAEDAYEAARAGFEDAGAERAGEAWPLLVRLGRVDGIAAVGTLYGQLLVMAEQREAALEVLSLAQEAWTVIGQDGNAEQVGQLIVQIRGGAG